MRKLTGYGPSLIVLGTTFLVLWAGPTIVRQLTWEATRQRIEQASNRLHSNDILRDLNQAHRDIADFVEPSVVHISAKQITRDRVGRDRPSLSSGSGWVYDDDGHIVTNHHVIENATKIEVQFANGQLRPAQVVGFDEFTDIAVIKVPPGMLHPATLSERESPITRGELVFAFGSPFDFRFSMSSGLVSGTGRTVGIIHNRGGTQFGYESFIQIDATINPGNSGGPLTDYLGRVVGMNTAIATNRSGEGDDGQFAGIGLAIPLHMIEPVVSQLIEKGVVAKGYLGVRAEDLSPESVSWLQQKGFIGHGVYIRFVQLDGPARAAGVRVDDIITSVDGAPIASMNQFRSEISSKLPGESIRLHGWRYDDITETGEAIIFDVTLAQLDLQASSGPAIAPPRQLPELGIGSMETNTLRRAGRFGTEYVQGVLIEDVVAGSSLDRAGIEPGAVITEVRGYPISGVDEFVRELRKGRLDQGVPVRIRSTDGTFLDVSLEVGG